MALNSIVLGASRTSCDFSGINVKNIELLAFILSGFFAGLGGLIYSSKLAAASPLIGSDVPIFVITAVLAWRDYYRRRIWRCLKNSFWYIPDNIDNQRINSI